jgi:hypothetical protein
MAVSLFTQLQDWSASCVPVEDAVAVLVKESGVLDPVARGCIQLMCADPSPLSPTRVSLPG